MNCNEGTEEYGGGLDCRELLGMQVVQQTKLLVQSSSSCCSFCSSNVYKLCYQLELTNTTSIGWDGIGCAMTHLQDPRYIY